MSVEEANTNEIDGRRLAWSMLGQGPPFMAQEPERVAALVTRFRG